MKADLKVLVTGAAGYIGSVLCERLLREGYTVLAVDNLMYGEQNLYHLCAEDAFEFSYGDARDEGLMRPLIRRADVLVPLAAIVGAPACDRDPFLSESVNLGAVKLINHLRSNSQLIVFPTTNSGYGTRSGDLHCTEETPLEPISLYGRTKVLAEKELLGADNAISLRLATVFGLSPRMRLDLLINHFVYAAVAERYLVVFEKDFKRNFVHIRDVADCVVYTIQHGDQMRGNAFNVGLDSANLSKAELALKIKEHVEDFYVHFAEVGSDPDKRNYVVSNEKLRKAGFQATRSVDDGIRELVKGYRLMGRQLWKNV